MKSYVIICLFAVSIFSIHSCSVGHKTFYQKRYLDLKINKPSKELTVLKDDLYNSDTIIHKKIIQSVHNFSSHEESLLLMNDEVSADNASILNDKGSVLFEEDFLGYTLFIENDSTVLDSSTVVNKNENRLFRASLFTVGSAGSILIAAVSEIAWSSSDLLFISMMLVAAVFGILSIINIIKFFINKRKGTYEPKSSKAKRTFAIMIMSLFNLIGVSLGLFLLFNFF